MLPPESWVLDVLRRSRLIDRLTQPFASLMAAAAGGALVERKPLRSNASARRARLDNVSVGHHRCRALGACALGGRPLRHPGSDARGCRHRLPAWARHVQPDRRADRARQYHLGADRRLGRHTAAVSPISSSRWRNFSPPSRPIFCSRSRCRRSSRSSSIRISG